MSRTSSLSKSQAAGRTTVSRSKRAPAGARANRKERVLIEFPSALLKRADEVARSLETNRSGLIRSAVERLLVEVESREFERQLAAGYAANANMNRALAREFSEVDREGF
jgi:metal-responsive CopG/Arc/MetJ family transcriptional regulator